MNVLVVNAGSSSLKYQLFDTKTMDVIAKGLCERIGMDGGRIAHNQADGTKVEKFINMSNHAIATKELVDILTDPVEGCIKSMDEIEAVGHRIVHGGSYFSKSVIATPDVISKLEKCMELAPLHTGPHLMGIQGCTEVMPGVTQVLVFDTAFHQTMPECAYFYPLTYEVYEKYGIRRYGAHGTSHRYVASEMIKLLGGKAEGTKIITCHLGNGSSISAVKDGKVIDTSMGFTPLDGIEMGTRCGAIDPAIVPFIMEKTGMSPAEINDFMNKKCGLLGVSGVSSDMRDIEKGMKEGNARCKLAFDILIYQIKKYIGSYTAAMNGLDAIVFTAGIGENSPNIREKVCNDMEFFGIDMDKEINQNAKVQSDIVRLSTDNSKVKVYLIPTNEEFVIASDTAEIVGRSAKAKAICR